MSQQGLIKLTFTDSFDPLVEAGARMITDNRLVKSASTIFNCEYDALKPDKDHVGIHLVALGDYEHYGCFFEGTPVQTIYGQVPIEEIKEGDLVLTHTGKYRKVVNTFEDNYTGDSVRIECVGTPAVVCTANHPFRVVRREGLDPTNRFSLREKGKLSEELEKRAENAEVSRADNLRPGDFLLIKTELDVEDIDLISPEYDPYVLGFYVAEGCLVKEYRDISTKGEYKHILFTGSLGDTDAFDYIDNWLISIGRTPCARGEAYTSDTGVRYQLGFKELALKLDQWFGHLATSKHLHPAVWTWSKEDRIKFLAGYFDGDGCIQDTTYNRYYGTLVANTASRTLVFDIQRLLASVGIPSSIVKGLNKRSNGCFGNSDHVIYHISIGSYYSNIILNHTLRLKLHKRQFKQAGAFSMQLAKTFALIKVSKIIIESVEDVTKYNIEVEEDHSYVVNNITVMNSNRNYDAFTKKACKEYHPTFLTGHNFEHHKNKDPKDAVGVVKASAYNEDMGRIELFIHAHKDKAAKHLSRMEKEGQVPVSMACFVREDRCSVCGNLRKSASDPKQCDHIKNHFGETWKDGQSVFTYNDEPRWFDISFVTRPADRIAWDLKKVAEANSPAAIVSSVDLAKEAGLFLPSHMVSLNAEGMAKLAICHKLAELELLNRGLDKKASLGSYDRYIRELRKGAVCKLAESQIDFLRQYEPKSVFTALARRGVVMDPESFFKYAFGNDYGDMRDSMPGIISNIRNNLFDKLVKTGQDTYVCNNSYFDVDTDGQLGYITDNVKLASFVRRELVEPMSLLGDYVHRRAIENTINGRQVEASLIGEVKEAQDTGLVEQGASEVYGAYKLSALRGIIATHGAVNKDKDAEDSLLANAAICV